MSQGLICWFTHCSSIRTVVRQLKFARNYPSYFGACKTRVHVVHCSSTNTFIPFSLRDPTDHGCGISTTKYCIGRLTKISSNLAKGWHNGFRCLMDRTNHIIWRFVDVLKKEQDLTDWKINQKMMRQPLLLNRRSRNTTTDS